MCFFSSAAAEVPEVAAAPAPPAAPAKQQPIGKSRKKENLVNYGANGGPQTRRDTSADGGLSGGSGLRM